MYSRIIFAISVPPSSEFAAPIKFLEEANEFIGAQVTSDEVDKELKKMSSMFPWINEDDASTYFELTLGNVPEYMESMSMVASKTYTRGLIIISVYFDYTIYFLVQSGEGYVYECIR